MVLEWLLRELVSIVLLVWRAVWVVWQSRRGKKAVDWQKGDERGKRTIAAGGHLASSLGRVPRQSCCRYFWGVCGIAGGSEWNELV